MKFFAGVAAGIIISLALLLVGGYIVLDKAGVLPHMQENAPAQQSVVNTAQNNMADFKAPTTPDELIQFLNRQIAANPKDYKTHLAKAAVLAEMGRHEDALKAYDRAIFLNPTDPSAYLSRAVSYFATGNFAKAKEDLSTAITLNPQLAEAYYNRGVANVNMAQLRPALEDFKQATALFSKMNDQANAQNSINAANIIQNYARGVAAAKTGKKAPPAQKPQDLIAIQADHEMAKNYTSDLVAGLKSSNGGSLIEKFKNASAGVSSGQGFDERAFATFEQSIKKVVSESGDSQKTMQKTSLDYRSDAQKNMREKNYKAAVEDLDKAIEKSPNDPSLYTERAMANAAQRNTKDAINDFTKAIEMNPKDAGSYYNRANQRSLMGDTAGAIEDAKKAEELFDEQGNEHGKTQAQNMSNMLQGKSVKSTQADNESQRLLAKGTNAYSEGNYKEAVASFNALIARENKKGNKIPELYYNRGIANAAAGNDEAALADYKNAGNLPDAQVGAGVILSKQGKLDEAWQYFNNATEMNPEHATAFRMKGAVSAQKMEKAEDPQEKQRYQQQALSELNQSIHYNSNDGAAYLTRGLVYANSGELDRAAQDLERSETLAKQQNDPNLLKQIQALRSAIQQAQSQQGQ